jgi:hypothetical protein
MNEDLSIQGTLADTTVPDLFRTVIRSGETAILSLEPMGRQDAIYFHEGKLVFATSSDPDLGLAETLLRSGELNLAQYQRATEGSFTSMRIGAILCELGYLQSDELTRALERQASNIVMHALALRMGSYSVDFGSELTHDTIRLHLNTERLVLDGINRIEDWSLISRGIGSMTRLVKQAPNADARIFHLDLTEEESHVYSQISEPRPIEALCENSYLSNFATCRTVWGLLAVNLLEDAGDVQVDQRRDVELRELELEAIVERYNRAFEGVYGVVFQKIGDYTYDFMDRIVSSLSPEVQRYLSGINLVNEGRVDFDQLLNNLIASGSADQRSAAAEVLNELLYGWIYEIKKNFGAELDGGVNNALAVLKR